MPIPAPHSGPTVEQLLRDEIARLRAVLARIQGELDAA